jgi:hypothetical protein
LINALQARERNYFNTVELLADFICFECFLELFVILFEKKNKLKNSLRSELEPIEGPNTKFSYEISASCIILFYLACLFIA